MDLRGAVRRDGFIFANGKFLTDPGNMERFETTKLREMFGPKLSQEVTNMLARTPNFVLHQLKHYGITFEADRIYGKGVTAMKQALRQGRLDTVPGHILKLQNDMYQEWLDLQSPESSIILSQPDLLVDKLFMRRGKPDMTKTLTPIGILCDGNGQPTYFAIVKAVRKVEGLHHQMSSGQRASFPASLSIPDVEPVNKAFLGWDPTMLHYATNKHAAEDEQRIQDARKRILKDIKKRQDHDNERQSQRKLRHPNYLTTRKDDTADLSKRTPIGSYIVECRAIQATGVELPEDLTIEICKTNSPKIFKAEFNFGIHEGVMIICANQQTLDDYCDILDIHKVSDESEYAADDESSEGDGPFQPGTKKKAAVSPANMRKNKKTPIVPLRKYLLKHRGRHTDGGQHCSEADEADEGTILFDQEFTRFDGEMDLNCVGSGVPFCAYKISDVPKPSGKEWYHYLNTDPQWNC